MKTLFVFLKKFQKRLAKGEPIRDSIRSGELEARFSKTADGLTRELGVAPPKSYKKEDMLYWWIEVVSQCHPSVLKRAVYAFAQSKDSFLKTWGRVAQERLDQIELENQIEN